MGVYVADFEVTKTINEDVDVRVYATGLCRVDDDIENMIYRNNINDFMNDLLNLEDDDNIIYFHNFGGYDGVFTIEHLVNNLGFKQILGEKYINSNGIFKMKKIKNEQRVNGTYEIIYAKGTIFRLDVYLGKNPKYNPNTKSNKPIYKIPYLKKITFLDSYKIASFPLTKIAEDFLGYKIPKDGINHNIIRPKGYILTDEEYSYLKDDIRVLKDFIKLIRIDGIQVNDNYNLKIDKMTISAQALSVFKDFLKEDEKNKNNNYIKDILKNSRDYKSNPNNYYSKKDKKLKIYDLLFPKLNLKEDLFIRQSYFGGITYKNSDLINTLTGDIGGLVYDVNSLYPSVMRTRLLPYGSPLFFIGKYDNLAKEIKVENPLYFQQIQVDKFKIKKGFIPNIQIKNSVNFNNNIFLKDNSYIDKNGNKKYEKCTFVFTNIQLDYFLKSYEVEGITYLGGYAFQGSYNIFNTYIDNFMQMKINGSGAVKNTAKLFLNSLYGKFGTNPLKENRIVEFNKGIFSTTNKINDETQEYYEDCIFYLPMASFITSYAREVLLTTIEKVYNRFLYCDTDSIHILGYELPNITIHDKNLGAWKCEGKFVNAKYIGAKRYAELMINEKENKTEWLIKCCGLSRDIMEKLTIDIFDVCEYDSKYVKKNLDKFYTKDDIFYYKDEECSKKVVGLVRSKKKKQVKGGILIEEQPYMITDRNYFLK